MLSRIAVITVLFCIGILLLSACGWQPSPKLPYVYAESFSLWQTVPGAPDRFLGTGFISGTPARVNVSVRLVRPLCSQPTEIHMTGLIVTGKGASTLTLYDGRNAGDAALAGVFHPPARGLATLALPFSGSLTLNNSCGRTSAIQVAARASTTVDWRWTTKRPAKPWVSINLAEFAGPQPSTYEWGTIQIRDSACFRNGSVTSALNAGQTSLDASFAMDDGSILRAPGLPTGWRGRKIAIHTTLTVSGGRCDGQTFSVDLEP